MTAWKFFSINNSQEQQIRLKYIHEILSDKKNVLDL